MEYTADKKTASSKPLVKKIPVLIIGLALLIGGATVYRLTQIKTSESEIPVQRCDPQPRSAKGADRLRLDAPRPGQSPFGTLGRQPRSFYGARECAPRQTMPEIKTVTALGRLEPNGEIIQISVSSGASGNRIDELLVKEGDEIEKGQIIAVLDSRDRLEAALNQSQEQVGVAEANLNLVKAGAKTGEIRAQEAAIARIEAETDNNIVAQTATVSRIKAELNNAQIEYKRYEQLYKDGAISASERDSKYLALETAKEQVAEAQANLNRIKSSQQQQLAEAKATLDRIAEIRPVDISVVEAEVRQAQAAVKTAQAELDRAYIKSPQAGTVIKVLTRPGEIVKSDEGIARIGQIKEMYAVAEVYESDISKVKLGQLVTVTSSAIDGQLQGRVEKIGLEIERQNVVNTDPTANIDARVVEVKVKLDDASSQKVAGLTNLQVKVKIEL